jgi:peptidoglycan/xylan/chitin deacetylase (PgdA/CDA1 family)
VNNNHSLNNKKSPANQSRRSWLRELAVMGSVVAAASQVQANQPRRTKAKIAITMDLEMARNFPRWEDTHWDYEKGNLDKAAKDYSLKAGDLVKSNAGRIHYFLVGSALEQADLGWLKKLVDDGHPIGNHTYDHVNLLATVPKEIQFRFQRAPWLISGKSTSEVISQNIALAKEAIKDSLKIDNRGFRTPGGFHSGLEGREDLQKMLLELGFTWVSSKYPSHPNSEPQQPPTEAVQQGIVSALQQAQPLVYPTGLVEIPMSPISDIGAFRNGRWKLEWFLEVIQRAVQWTIENRAVFDFLAHPSCLGVVDPDCQTIQLICDQVRQAGDRAELVDLDNIAAGFLGQ